MQTLFSLVSGSVVQKQYAFRGNKYGSDGESVQQAHAHPQLHSIGNGLWELLLCGGKFAGNVQVSSLFYLLNTLYAEYTFHEADHLSFMYHCKFFRSGT